MPEQREKPKIVKPKIKDIYEQYITDETLRKGAELLFNIARKHNMKNRWMSYNSFTFTYRGTNIFNITMRATMKNKGVRKIDPTNHFIVQLSLGKKYEADTLLHSQSETAQIEYVTNKYISCMVCAGTPEGYAIRNLKCDNVLYFKLAGETYPLCMLNFGYACHNPTPEQFEIIEQFIIARIKVIDTKKAK